MSFTFLSISKHFLILVFIIHLSAASSAQDRNIYAQNTAGINYGFGIKLELDLGLVGYKPKIGKGKLFGDVICGMALSTAVGIGYSYDYFTPMYHLGFRLSQGRGMIANSGSYNLKEETLPHPP